MCVCVLEDGVTTVTIHRGAEMELLYPMNALLLAQQSAQSYTIYCPRRCCQYAALDAITGIEPSLNTRRTRVRIQLAVIYHIWRGVGSCQRASRCHGPIFLL